MQVAPVNNTFSYPLNASQVRQPAIDRKSKLYEVSQQFEAIFIKQMLDAMRQTLNKEDDLFNGGMSQDIFEDMLYDEYANKMAQTAQFGLADTIYRQLSSK